ncbi:MAG TPA: TonB-dependent receptor, partial [Gemmatimonadaceae bacterium]|nr:TonB-dependent receptor [Gemmatimonadaceae bacterium]
DTARVAPMVTSATRIPVPAHDVPASVTVITGAQLRALGITTVADALAGTPGVTIEQSGSAGALTSLFLRGGESKYVKVLVDGVPVNDPGGAFDFATLTTDNVARIEILRGPASVLYGADAVSGVVSIITRGGSAAPRLSLSARGGTYHTGDALATLRGGGTFTGGGSAGYALSVARHQTDGLYPFNNGFAENVVSARVDLRPGAADTFALTLRYTDSRYHYPTNSAGSIVDHNAFDDGDRVVLGAVYGHAFSPAAAVHLALTSAETGGGTTDQPDTTGGDLYLSLDHVRRHGADAQFDLRDPSGRGVFTLGGSLSAADQNSQAQGAAGGYAYTSDFTAYRGNRAAYAQLLYTGVPRFTAVAGARVDDNQTFGAFGTYRAGANYVTAAGTRLRASVGTAFRAPSFYENFSTGYVTGNPGLRPEHTLSWEAGVEQALAGGRLSVGVTAFSQTFRDMIDYAGDTTACGFSYCNVARARAAGLEYTAQASLVSWLSASAGFTHLATRVLTAGFDTTSGGLYHLGQALIRRPATSWNAALEANARTRGAFDVRFTYVGRRADRDYSAYPALPVTVPGYLLVDIGGRLPISSMAGGRGTDLTLRVQNVGGVAYQSVYGFRAPGRTVLLGLRAEM